METNGIFYENTDGVKFFVDGRDTRTIMDIIVPLGVKAIDMSKFKKEDLRRVASIRLIDIADNGRTYPTVEHIAIGRISVKAKNAQFPSVENVRIGTTNFGKGRYNTTPILFSDIEHGVIGNILGDAAMADISIAFRFITENICIGAGALEGHKNLKGLVIGSWNRGAWLSFMPGAFSGCGIKPDENGIYVLPPAGIIADIDEDRLRNDSGDVVLDLPVEKYKDSILSLTAAEKADEIVFHSMSAAIKNSDVLRIAGKRAPRVFLDRDGRELDAENSTPYLAGYRNFGGKYLAKDDVLFSSDLKTLISFPHAKRLEEYDIPEGVEKIGRAAFSGARIRKIVMPDSVKILREGAFSDCEAESIVLSNGINAIGAFAKSARTITGKSEFSVFSGAHIRRITIPESVKYIGPFSFLGCGNLTDVEFKEGGSCVIDDSAFVGCPLKDIKLPKSCVRVGETVFDLPQSVRLYQGTGISPTSFTAALGNEELSQVDERKLLMMMPDYKISSYTAIRIIDAGEGREFFSPAVCDQTAMEEFAERWSFGEVDETYFSCPPTTFESLHVQRTITRIQTAKYGNEKAASEARTYIRRSSKKTTHVMLNDETCAPFLREMIKEDLISSEALKSLLEEAIEKGNAEIATEVSEKTTKKTRISPLSL